MEREGEKCMLNKAGMNDPKGQTTSWFKPLNREVAGPGLTEEASGPRCSGL